MKIASLALFAEVIEVANEGGSSYVCEVTKITQALSLTGTPRVETPDLYVGFNNS